jgi:MoxR-like ATPase
LYHVSFPVLRHRILMNFKAEAERITPDQVTQHLLKKAGITNA